MRAIHNALASGTKPHDILGVVAARQSQAFNDQSNRLGHSSVSMTLDIYGHSIPSWQRDAAEAFARAMQKDSSM